jgi:hypothetical protein
MVDSSDEWEGYRQQERKLDEPKILNAFERNLLSFIAICRINNIEPILMTQFNRFTNSPDSIVLEQFKKGFDNKIGISNYTEMKIICDKFNSKIREVCKENNVKLLDLALLVPQKKNFIYDSFHLNEFGSALVGDIITDFFLKNHLESICIIA